jgi:hypothetical protein
MSFGTVRDGRESAPHGNCQGVARGISRRRFVQGLAATGVIAGFELWRWPALAMKSIAEPTVLAGKHFDLVIDETLVNFTGRSAVTTAINGSIPGPLLRWREGDTVTIAVTNRLKVPTSIHWHGVRSPADMDGVPGLSFPGIAAGETFTYRIPVKQSGTYWYHSHSRFQEQHNAPSPGKHHRFVHGRMRKCRSSPSDFPRTSTSCDPHHVTLVAKPATPAFFRTTHSSGQNQRRPTAKQMGALRSRRWAVGGHSRLKQSVLVIDFLCHRFE